MAINVDPSLRHLGSCGCCEGVTVISGLGLPPVELEALATELKKRCGSGGAIENGRIEIQGDHRDRIVEELIRRGWKAKRAGG